MFLYAAAFYDYYECPVEAINWRTKMLPLTFHWFLTTHN